MERMIGEAAAHEDRHLDALEHRGQGFVPCVAFGPRDDLAAQVGLRARGDPRQPVPHDAEAVFANAAGAREVTVQIAEPLPRADRSEVRRMQGRDFVLADGEVGNAEQTGASVRPRLRRCPLDQIVVILGLLVGEELAHALRRAAAAQIGVDDRVAVGHPERRVGCFPTRVLRDLDPARLKEHAVLRIDAPMAARLGGDAVLAVGMGRHDDRRRRAAGRAKDVDAQDRSVANGYRHVPVDGDARRRRAHHDVGVQNIVDTASDLRHESHFARDHSGEPPVASGKWFRLSLSAGCRPNSVEDRKRREGRRVPWSSRSWAWG